MDDPKLEFRTAKLQARLALIGTVFLSLAGAAAGFSVSPWVGLAGLLAPIGCIALFFSLRRPPQVFRKVEE